MFVAADSENDLNSGHSGHYTYKNDFTIGDDGVPAILQYRPSDLYPTDRKETVAILQKDTHTPLRICK